MQGNCVILIEFRRDLEECFLMFVDNLIHKNNHVIAALSIIGADNVWQAVLYFKHEGAYLQWRPSANSRLASKNLKCF